MCYENTIQYFPQQFPKPTTRANVENLIHVDEFRNY